MAEEPDNLLLHQLRELRRDVGDIKQSVAAIETRMAEADRQHEELRGWVVHSLGLSSATHLRTQNLQAEIDDLAAKVQDILDQV